MTSVLRRPFAPRQPDPVWSNKSPAGHPLRQTASGASYKRPRSPDVIELANAKRAKATIHSLCLSGGLDNGEVDAHPAVQKPTSTSTRAKTPTLACEGAEAGETEIQPVTQHPTTTRDAKDRKERLRQKEEREQAREQANSEFILRYTKAFPKFVFYFDDRDNGRQYAESKVTTLGARIEFFFSASVTHVITNCPQPPKDEQLGVSSKENTAPKRSGSKEGMLRSPIQLKSRIHDHGGYDKLVRDAVQLHKKIWSVSKLENILSRLLPNDTSKAKTRRTAELDQLLHHERVHGTTSERDPRERRHDYQYFSKNSHFFLVEDIRSELAPIAIMEYPLPVRSTEKAKEPSYPCLYMDHRARSPFVKYDDKEARKQDKAEMTERLKDIERNRLRAKVKRELKREHEKQLATKTLRRCASMSQLGRKVVTCEDPELDESAATFSNSPGLGGDTTTHEQVASGFGQSAAGASTGNGYLAASGNSVPITSTTTTSVVRTGSSLRLPQNLRERLARQVVTTRMGESRLRKAKSTATMRLPTRDENKKPGYCEACRTKFEDFKDHVQGSRHRKFAMNENNYIDLDFLLCRLERKPFVDIDDCGAESPQSEVKLQDESSDACLRPGDYFYVSPKMEDDWDEEESGEEVPQIVIEEHTP